MRTVLPVFRKWGPVSLLGARWLGGTEHAVRMMSPPRFQPGGPVMTVSRLLSVFAVSLALAVLSVLLGPGDVQAKIKCNSILGPGGTYVLDRDLTCPQAALKPGDSDDNRIGVLKVI